jgi:hypothetical protein
MTMLTDITRTPPSGEALIRVYKGQLILNAAAKKLLALKDDSKVAFRSGDNGPNGTKRLYIAKKAYSAYSLVRNGRAYRIRSTSLCKAIADMLQGYGTYRIEGETPIRDFNGDICYSIFFRRYE